MGKTKGLIAKKSYDFSPSQKLKKLKSLGEWNRIILKIPQFKCDVSFSNVTAKNVTKFDSGNRKVNEQI